MLVRPAGVSDRSAHRLLVRFRSRHPPSAPIPLRPQSQPLSAHTVALAAALHPLLVLLLANRPLDRTVLGAALPGNHINGFRYLGIVYPWFEKFNIISPLEEIRRKILGFAMPQGF